MFVCQICQKLAERERAKVGNISPEFCNCLSLIDEQNLYRLGLELFQADSEKRHLIFVSLGEHLMKEKQYLTALSVFLAAEPSFLDGAKRAARAAGDWRCFFSLFKEDLDTLPENMEIKAEQRRQLARDVAGEIVSEVGPEPSQKRMEAYSGAAHILLDYGNDLLGAIDMLLKGYNWSEANRIALHYSRQDLVKKCADAAVAYAYTAMDDFQDKINTFTSTNERYAEVLKLRKRNVFIEGPDPAEEADETGSLFSAASNYSNMSLQSATSNTSISSGVSSVISVKTSTTFTMTGDDGINRHRSKFNKGKKEKKRKKKRKARRKPGSVEELNGLVQTLRLCCADSHYSQTISQTIRFLILSMQSFK